MTRSVLTERIGGRSTSCGSAVAPVIIERPTNRKRQAIALIVTSRRGAGLARTTRQAVSAPTSLPTVVEQTHPKSHEERGQPAQGGKRQRTRRTRQLHRFRLDDRRRCQFRDRFLTDLDLRFDEGLRLRNRG